MWILEWAKCGLGLVEPCKSRRFPPNWSQQTSFSVYFLFSAACELWRRSPGSIYPGWILGRTYPCTAFQSTVRVNLRFQRPVQRQDHPAEPLAAVLPEKASCPISAACSGVGALACSGHGVQKQGHGALPQPGYFFLDGHSVFKGLVHR